MNGSDNISGLHHPQLRGDFSGHALPGTFFFVMGVWWSTKSMLKYVCKKQKKTFYLHSKALFRRAEILEGIALLFMVLLGTFTLQFLAGRPKLPTQSEPVWSVFLRFHHMTIYFFFALLGVVNILCFVTNSIPVPLTKLTLSIAFFMESFIFYHHTHDREVLDGFAHHLLFLAAFLTGLFAFLEFLVGNNILLELLRSSCVMLQGSWFWQIGFVVFPISGMPTWDLTDNENVVFLAACYCWHYALAYIITGANYVFITWLVKNRLRRFCPSEEELLKNAEEEQESHEEMGF